MAAECHIQRGVAADNDRAAPIGERRQPRRDLLGRGEQTHRPQETQAPVPRRIETGSPRRREVSAGSGRRRRGEFDARASVRKRAQRLAPERREILGRYQQPHRVHAGIAAGEHGVHGGETVGEAGGSLRHEGRELGKARRIAATGPAAHDEPVPPGEQATGGTEWVHFGRAGPEPFDALERPDHAGGALGAGDRGPAEAKGGLEDTEETARPYPGLPGRGLTAAERARPAARIEVGIEDDAHGGLRARGSE